MTKSNSVARVTPNNAGRKAGHARQNNSVTAGSSERITARRQLADLSKWVDYLHTQRGWSFRRIAEHTTRGKGSHGYWQSVNARAHMGKAPRIRPCLYDWHDLKILYLAVSSTTNNTDDLIDALLDVSRKQSELSAAIVRAMDTAAKIARG